MEEKTKEEILVDYIKDLLTLVSFMGIFVDAIFKWAQWYSDGQDKLPFHIRDKQTEILKFLEENYGVKYTILDRYKETDAELLLQSKEDTKDIEPGRG